MNKKGTKKPQEAAEINRLIQRKKRNFIVTPNMKSFFYTVVGAIFVSFIFFYFSGSSSTPTSSPKHIGLVVMVKNENATITRLLDSAKGQVQSFIICDTGSDDGTLFTINSYGEALSKEDPSIQFAVFKHKWHDDFSYNRNLCMNMAKKRFPNIEYILTIDADEVLQINDANWRSHIPYDHNSIIYEGDSYHPLPRLVSTKYPFKYICTVHEIINYMDNTTSGLFKGVSIVNYADGHSSEGDNRHVRNVLLLKKGLERGFDDVCYSRYTFYMGEAMYELGLWSNATFWHKIRIGLGGYQEEVYNSIYKLGMSYTKQGGLPTNTSGVFLQAWEYRPWRGEALYALADLHKNSKNYHACKLFAERVAEMPYPASDSLFVYKPLYSWQAHDMAAFCSFYVNDFTTAQSHWESALENLPSQYTEKQKSLTVNINLCKNKIK